MAKQTGGNGSGASKIPADSETQDAIRRAAKKNRRKNRGSSKDGVAEPLMAGVYQDRADARAEREADYRDFLAEKCEATLRHLKRFGGKPVPGGNSNRPRWSPTALEAVERLLNLYFFGPRAEIEVREGVTGKQVIIEVRRRFAGVCHLDHRIKNTPGQSQPWFAGVLADTVTFYAEQKATRKAARQVAPIPDAPAATEKAAADEPALVNA